MRADRPLVCLPLVLALLNGCCGRSPAGSPRRTPNPAVQVPRTLREEEEKGVLSPEQMEGEWHGVRIDYDKTYSEARWDGLDLAIRTLSRDEPPHSVVPRFKDDGPWEFLSVTVYGYWPGETSRYPIRDMEPGWVETDDGGAVSVCLGPIGSHFRLRARLDGEGLLHLEGGPFRAAFKRAAGGGNGRTDHKP